MWHDGPAAVYMSKANGDVREYDGSGDWFKVAEIGLNLTVNEQPGQEWAVEWAIFGQHEVS